MVQSYRYRIVARPITVRGDLHRPYPPVTESGHDYVQAEALYLYTNLRRNIAFPLKGKEIPILKAYVFPQEYCGQVT